MLQAKDLRIGKYIMQSGKITCVEKLSRYNESDFFSKCSAKKISQERNMLLDMIKNVNI